MQPAGRLQFYDGVQGLYRDIVSVAVVGSLAQLAEWFLEKCAVILENRAGERFLSSEHTDFESKVSESSHSSSCRKPSETPESCGPGNAMTTSQATTLERPEESSSNTFPSWVGVVFLIYLLLLAVL